VKCLADAEIQGGVTGHIDGGEMWVSESSSFDNEAIVSITWSYTTSTEPGVAGQASDVFLIPTLAIMYRETDTITWDVDACEADKITRIKFDLSSDENRNPISFFSYELLVNEIIPELKKNLQLKVDERDSFNEDDIPTHSHSSDYNKTVQEIITINSSLQGESVSQCCPPFKSHTKQTALSNNALSLKAGMMFSASTMIQTKQLWIHL
jgi:hypothetical protein